MSSDSDSDLEFNPLNVLLQADDNDGVGEDQDQRLLVTEEQNLEGGGTGYKEQQHYLHSIKTSVVVRQLPSQGLSFQLWPAATTLVNLLDHHQSGNNIKTPLSAILDEFRLCQQPLRILELGSGTGLAGIAAAAVLSSSCTITDLPHVLPNLQFNAAANSEMLASRGGSVNVAALRWGEKDDMELVGREFDVILGSDVVYYDYLYDPLLQTLRFFLGGGEGEDRSNAAPVFLMAHLKRWKKDSVFFRKARKRFDVKVIQTDTPAPGCRIGVVVYCFSMKKKQSGGHKHINPDEMNFLQ
ncbi:hypothetical protein MKW94_029174 [Papaver nudicaule]|uniref:Uncharacterized protein n=1 Tax=Papaver nudicaule TaxID=74823 RepID=A0AA41V9V7_PAPNU|nr:hypothetical protein [Papaver nudicaule]